MMEKHAEKLVASFVSGTKDCLFCLCAEPAKSIDHRIILVPPFAEEMNCCRHFFAQIRQRLCSKGFTVIQPDMFGTGDSVGQFGDATWQIWKEDLKHCFLSDVHSESLKTSVLAIRSGCLLIQDCLLSCDTSVQTTCIENLIYIQPERIGRNVIDKLLRLQIASDRLAGKDSKTRKMLWEQFEKGGSLSIAGYEIGAELATQMRDVSINSDSHTFAGNHVWLELADGADESVIPDQWYVHLAPSKPFWQVHDIEPDEELIDFVVSLING